MERTLFAAFRRGDNETGGRILKELMDCIADAVPGNLEIIRFRAIELIVLLSRAAVPEASGSDALLEANNRYLKRIQESKTAEELIENMNLIAERMAIKIFSFQGVRHASVLRKAERYIWENYTRKLSLEEISGASGLSAPYFSTIFKEEMKENLSSYLNRLRVEKAQALLAESGKPLNEIAELCGFEDQSWFSKIFKNFTGTSPGKYRKNGGGSPALRHGRNPKAEIKFPGSMIPEIIKQEMLSS
jgi:AraC-like DNA-binding protein